MYSKGKKSKKRKIDRNFDYHIETSNHEYPLYRCIAIVGLRRAAGDFKPVS